jgi:dTDP-4-amino-4,6-dideoxygalactose transaminase
MPIWLTQSEDNSTELDVVMAAAGRDKRDDFPEAFASAVAAFAGLRHGCVVSSDCAAVSTLVAALGLEPGDTVLVAAHLRTSFVFPLLHAGLRLVFVDCLTPALTLETASIEQAAKAGFRAAVLAAPWGIAQDLTPIRAALRDEGVLVLDATDCISPTLAGSALTAHADVTIVSFSEGQSPLSTGEGGAILSNDRGLIERAVCYQRFADLEGLLPGVNFKISSMQAALGLHRLKRMEAKEAATHRTAQAVGAALSAAGAAEGPKAIFGTHILVRLPAQLPGSLGALTRLPCAHRLAAAALFARPCPALDALAEGFAAFQLYEGVRRYA